MLPAGSMLHAQNAIFLKQGRIEFEKKENLWARIDSLLADDDDGWKELEKKMEPQFKTTYFNLYFNGNKCLYQPGRDEGSGGNGYMPTSVGDENIIYSDLATLQGTGQKTVFSETFLIQDSLRKIKWKITDETRNIAGFECRRANAIIMDSVYIVAFYTNSIITPGGPESFTGLPGMILGVAIPHAHISWFATKVYTETVKDTDLKIPVKGRKENNASLLLFLKPRLKEWGRYGTINLQAIMY